MLLVNGDIGLADNLSSSFSFILAAVLAGTGLVLWLRGRRHEAELEREVASRAADRARPEDHWLRSARGADATTGFFFTGRAGVIAALRAVTARGDPALAVVLGMPGAGKSAVLGVLVARSRGRSALPDGLGAVIPDIGIDCAVHARSKSLSDVIGELNAAVGVRSIDASHEQEPLFAALRERSRTIVVVDAVDEALAPYDLSRFLVQLSWHAIVIVGTRPDEAARSGVGLAPRGMRARAAKVIDLSASENLDRSEVADYVRARLRADRRAGGYADQRRWTDKVLLDIIGREVAERAQDNFLVTQLVTDELLSRPPVRSLTRGWSASLEWPADFRGWMDRDLNRRLGRDRYLADALIPLAFVEKDGLPVDLWVEALAAIGPRTAGARGEVDRAISELGFFLAVTTTGAGSMQHGEGEVGFLLRHQEFAAYFGGGPFHDARSSTMSDVVLGSVPLAPDGSRKWGELRPYARRNLLAHAERARTLDFVLAEDPLCLAAVDPSSAVDATARATTPIGQDLGRLARDAAYGGGDSYVQRCAQLSFHARLAGMESVADTFAAGAGTQAWSSPWRAGGSSAAMPNGDSLDTTAVIPVSWTTPAAVVIDRRFRAEVIDLASRGCLGPAVELLNAEGAGPDMWSAREIAGSVYLAVAWEEHRFELWCLAGPSASTRAVASDVVPELIRQVTMVAGPSGIPLIALLTGDRPGRLHVRTVESGNIVPLDSGDLLGGDGIAAAFATAESSELVIASLGNGLRRVQVNAGSRTLIVTPVIDRPVTLLTVADAGNRAVALVSLDQQIHAVILGEGSPAAILGLVLGEGGPMARPALQVGDGVVRAAVVADGAANLWELLPDQRRIASIPVDENLREAAFVDEAGTLLAVFGFSGDVRILTLDSAGFGPERRVLPVGESGSRVLPAPAAAEFPPAVVTRANSGTTRIWLLDDQRRPAGEERSGAVRALACGTRDVAAIVSTDGTHEVRFWWPGRGSHPPCLDHGEPVENVGVAVDAAGVAITAVGDGRASLWTGGVGPDAPSLRRSWEVSPGLADHVAVARCGTGTIVALAGIEGAQLRVVSTRTPGDDAVAELPVPIAAFSQYRLRDDRLSVAAVDEDDVIHLATLDEHGHLLHRQRRTESGPVTGCLALSGPGDSPYVVTWTYTGDVHAWDTATLDIAQYAQLRLPECPTAFVGVGGPDTGLVAFTAPGGVMLWDLFGSGDTTLVRTRARQAGHLVAVGGRNRPRILCAYPSGTIAVIDPATATLSEIDVNCEFSHFVGLSNPAWAIGANGSAIVALQA